MLDWFKKKIGKKAEEQTDINDKPLIEDESVKNNDGTKEGQRPQDAAETEAERQDTDDDTAANQEEQEDTASGLFKKLSEKLAKTRESFTYQIDTLCLGRKEIDADLLDELEEILITADLGVGITQDLLEHARRKVARKELSDPESLKKVLKSKLKSYLTEHPAGMNLPPKGPLVIMVVGVNGVGKTTSIGKIAHKFINSGQSVLLAAGDTYRAAAVSQLSIWAERNGIDLVYRENADPSSVAFDAVEKAKSGQYDVLLVDTAGRLHTQTNLMEELKKIKRVIGKQIPGAPHEVMLVIDATTGQNGVSQAKLFDAAVDITGITLTKLDGTARGGIVANIAREMKTPIRFIGIGEQLEDLRDFDADDFIEALFQEA
ncbi:MAG: signal recognition particle-docking protein FtsY [Deltaproteobacteria bacterium]|nr:MAG: signal recognition particle-docking protein FtsY [Deltaproteobacteria bacterium]